MPGEPIMADAPTFVELVRRVRNGEQEAAAELVRQYEPFIRRAVRFRLHGAGLAAAIDSADLCQSVLGSFFVRVAAGEYDLAGPDDLVRLLRSMARNKLASQVRRERAARRDRRRNAALDVRDLPLVAPQPTPSQAIATAELLQEVDRRLTPDERRLVELRRQGHDWAAIAAEVGDAPTVLRKRLSRALDRVTRELGLEDVK
jgi:RNA polymerase sigma-70 factor (ECF subfamily)